MVQKTDMKKSNLNETIVKPNEKRRVKKSLLLLLFSFGATLILAAPLLLGNEQKAESQSSEEVIRILTVQTRPMKEEPSYLRERNYLGRVEAQRHSQLGFEVSGMLKKIHVREGQFVSQGVLVAELDTLRIEASKLEAETQLKEAQASYKLARATLERTRHAYELKAVSIQQLDEAISNMESQQSRVARVKAQVNRIAVDLAKSKIYAPYTGTIAKRNSDEGTVIGPGQAVLEIIETVKSEISIGFDRDVLTDLEVGSLLEATIRNRSLKLKIDRILPGREQTTRVVQVIAAPIEPDIELREADLVEVTIKQQVDTSGYWLPVSALTESSRGLWSCLVAVPMNETGQQGSATHRLVRRDIEIVSVEKDTLFIRGDFSAGEQVVVNGVHRVVPQQRVKIEVIDS